MFSLKKHGVVDGFFKFIGPLGEKVIDFFIWRDPGSRYENQFLIDAGSFETEIPTIGYASDYGPKSFQKLSKELGYFGYTGLGQKFQSRELKLTHRHLIYRQRRVSNWPIPRYKRIRIPLKDC